MHLPDGERNAWGAMTIEFDDAVAERLGATLRRTAAALRSQSGQRATATERALLDFAGAYAERFRDAAVIESEDRLRAAGVLTDLAEAVAAAAADAASERDRLRRHSEWRAREDQRRTERSVVGVGAAVLPMWGSYGEEPSTTPVIPRPITAVFTPRTRPRSGGRSTGTSSADPDHLRRFVADVRSADSALRHEAERVRSAWAAFRSACSWAPVERMTAIDGLSAHLDENAAIEQWADQIADAFDRAGSGSLPDVAIDMAASEQTPPSVLALFAAGLSPTEVAERWAALGLNRASRTLVAMLPLSVLARLGNLEGVAYWARDAANRAVLRARIARVEREIDSVAALVRRGGADAATAYRSLQARLRAEFGALRNIRAALRETRFAGPRRLVSLTEDIPPLASIAIGDLDTASSVTWAVPGMNTTTADMTAWTRAAQNVYDAQGKLGGPRDRAVVSWIGYDTPDETTVLGMAKARAGGDRLSASIHGLGAVRAGSMPTTNIVAHSYGTTTTAVALSTPGVHVDRFVSLGSAGLPDDVESAADLHADQVFAGQARDVWPVVGGPGDEWAHIGRAAPGHGVNPAAPDFGARVFGADGTTADDGTRLLGVWHHDVLNGDGHGYLDADTETLRNVGLATTGHVDQLTPGPAAAATNGAR